MVVDSWIRVFVLCLCVYGFRCRQNDLVSWVAKNTYYFEFIHWRMLVFTILMSIIWIRLKHQSWIDSIQFSPHNLFIKSCHRHLVSDPSKIQLIPVKCLKNQLILHRYIYGTRIRCICTRTHQKQKQKTKQCKPNQGLEKATCYRKYVTVKRLILHRRLAR